MMMNYVTAVQIQPKAAHAMTKPTPLMVHNYAKSCQSCSELIYTDQDWFIVKAKHGTSTEYFHQDYIGCQLSMSRGQPIYQHDRSRRVS